MKYLALILTTLAAFTAQADVQVKTARNPAPSAAFKFDELPAPSRTDAANAATLSLLDGRRDPNGAELAALTDGKLPANEDDPRGNFFLATTTRTGRVLLELPAVTEVTQVNTYSWHPAARGPQVYTLYAADGLAPGFDPKPDRNTNLEQSGWKRLAPVDTRPKDGTPGGQYAVSIADPAGKPLGSFRYLLFDVSATDPADTFANTFFSEIDVHDGKEHPVIAPVAPAPLLITAMAADKYEITFDISEMPELKGWVETKLKPTCVEWYPKIVEMLPSDGFTAPARFSVTFRKNGRGVAFASGNRITCAGEWFSRNLDGEAVGAVVHEMVHVVQQYGRNRRNPNPGWLVEGLADYIRWFLYEPVDKRPRVNPARAKYTDSYRTTGAFLDYVLRTHDKEIVRQLNAAMREGRYSSDLWTESTGKTIDELWADYIKTLQ